MRYKMFFILALATVATSCCKQQFDIEKERAAIIDVINRETDAYLARDMDAVCATHVHDSLNIRLTAGADNYTFLEGWDEVGRHLVGDQTEDDLNPELNITVEKSNYRMRIHPNSAFVVCDQKWTSQFDSDTTVINSVQVRFLEKIDDEWKIAFVSWVCTSCYNLEETEEIY